MRKFQSADDGTRSDCRVVTFNKLWLPDLSSIVTNEGKMKADFIFVQSLPIYSILLALNRTTVDYFSLDVVGLELDILKTIPWSKVNIRVICFNLFNYANDESGDLVRH